MQFEFFEGKGGSEITLRPDTLKEANELLRFSKNTIGKPDIKFWIDTDAPSCRVWMKKRVKQSVVISNNKADK